MKKLYNVTARVVELVWANSPEEATALLVNTLTHHHHFEVMPDGNTAFVSEPVECMGWEGDGLDYTEDEESPA
jgi:hypothetical protein